MSWFVCVYLVIVCMYVWWTPGRIADAKMLINVVNMS